MPSISSEARFFGLDLRALWRDVQRPWLGASRWPVLRWLTPAVPVRVLLADGADMLWLGTEQPKPGASASAARFLALQLPEDLVLRRRLRLPVMGEAQVAQAAALEVRGSSPFPLTDETWGYSTTVTGGDCTVSIVLASRKQVHSWLQRQAERIPPGTQPEVWVLQDGDSPVVLQGFGEARRAAFAQRWRRLSYVALGVLAFLAVAIAVTPTVQLRMRAVDAAAAYQAVTQRAAPAVREREALMQSLDKLSALSELLSERYEPLLVLQRLTQVLPDDTALQSFKMQGAAVNITGLTTNASTLVQLLGAQPGLRDVNAPTAATRLPGATKETFAIVFTLDPKVFGVAPAAIPSSPGASEAGGPNGAATLAVPDAGSAVASAAPSAAPSGPGAPATRAAASAPAIAPAPPATATTATTPPAPARPAVAAPAKPQAAGGAVFGGTATFGGTAPRPAAPASSVPVTSAKP